MDGQQPKPFLTADIKAGYGSEKAKANIDQMTAAKTAGQERQDARDEKRADRKTTWTNRWNKVKDAGQRAWDGVKSAGEIPGKIVDGADQLRTNAEVGAAKFKANFNEKANDITNKAADVVGGVVGFVEGLPDRAKAKGAELRLKALQEVAKGVKAAIEAANKLIAESQETDGGGALTAADNLTAKAGEHRGEVDNKKKNAKGLSSARGWLNKFSS